MKKYLIYIFLLLLVGCTIKLQQEPVSELSLGASVLFPYQGGTGLGSATAGQVGTCIKVSDDSPFTYELGTCGSGSGASADWVKLFSETAIRPSSTVGIFVSASSTIAANFRVDGKTTSTVALSVGSTVGVSQERFDFTGGDLYVQNDVYIGNNATTSGNLGVDGVIYAGDGDTTPPSYTFANDPDTGFYRAGNNEVSFVANGIEQFNLNAITGLLFVPVSTFQSAVTLNLGFISNAHSTATALIIGPNSTPSPNPLRDGQLFIGDTATSSGNFTFMGELMPDGATCSNGQILKKTGANDWDCSSDTGGGFNGAWQAILSNVLAPTNTAAGIIVNASSTFVGDFRHAGAQSTTTIENALQIGLTSGSNKLKVIADRTYPASDSVGGLVQVTNTLSGGAAISIYSNAGAIRTNDLLRIKNDNAASDQRALSISNDGTRSAALFDCTNTTRLTGGECVTITDVAGADKTTLGVSGAPIGLGLLKFTINNGADADASALSMQIDDTEPQGLFINTVTGYTGKFLNIRNDSNELLTLISTGFLGLATTTPYERLSVNGGIVSDYINATSTVATSTFSGGLSFMGEIAPDGVTCAVGKILKKTAADDWDCADDATGGGFAYPFTFGTTYETAVNQTTTPIWFKGSPFSLFASSTLAADQASTTQLTISSLFYFGGDVFDELVGDGLDLSSGDLIFDCSDVVSTGLQCSGEDLQLNATGDWTGTLDGYQGTDLLDLRVTSTNRIGGTLIMTAPIYTPTTSPASLYISQDAFIHGNATTTGFVTFSQYPNCTALETDDEGVLVCGSDGGGGAAYPFTFGTTYETATNVTTTPIWFRGSPISLFASSTSQLEFASTTVLTVIGPTYHVGSSGGIMVNASSTFNSTVNIAGVATTSALVIGTTIPRPSIDNPIDSGDLFIGNNATTSKSLTVGSTVGVTQADFDFGAGDFYANGDVFFGADATTSGNFSFNGEIMPDGIECANGEILKKTGANNWDCATDSGGGSDAFTHSPVFGQETSATSTLIYLTGSPYSLAASGTAALTQASTTQLTISSLLYLDSLAFDSLTDDATLDNNGGDLRVVDVTCTDCLNATEIEDIYLLIAGDTSSGTFTWSGAHTFDTQALTVNSSITLDTNGITIDTDGDGAVTFTGASAGNDESLTFNFDDDADAVLVTSGSGVTYMDWGTIGHVVTASSTQIGNFGIQGTATVTAGLVIGTTVPPQNPLSGGNLYVGGSATTVSNLWVGSVSNGVLFDSATGTINFFGNYRPTSTIMLTAGGATPTIGDSGSATSSKSNILLTTNRQMVTLLNFPEGSVASTSAQWQVQMPDNYDGGAVYATIYSTATSTTGNTRWCADAISYAHADALDGTWGSTYCWASQNVPTANTMRVSTSTLITIGGTPARNESVIFRVTRASAGNEDDRPDYGRLFQVKIEYRTNKLSY